MANNSAFITVLSFSAALLVTTAISLIKPVLAKESGMTEAEKKALDDRLTSQSTQLRGTEQEPPLWSESQQDQAKLEKIYQQAIQKEPENKKNYAYLAGLYLKNNKTAHAIEAYQDAIAHDPDNPKLFAAISIAYLHQAKFAMAKAMADEALRIDPSMKQVEKINQYIEAKQAAIDATSKSSMAMRKGGLTAHASEMQSLSSATSRLKKEQQSRQE